MLGGGDCDLFPLERIWRDDNAGDSNTPLCQSCYDRYYTSCTRCGRVILYDNACFLEDDPDGEEPMCHHCYSERYNNGIIEGYYWNELLRFSRRSQSQMEQWAARYGRKDDPKAMMDHAKKSNLGRYTCVNLTNESTIEFRMFRGTDASGIAYVQNGHIHIQKAPRPARRMKWRIDPAARVIMSHTRMTTQGSEKSNYNNHPFFGKAGRLPFALAHNGVLCNDKALRRTNKLSASRIETDSYVAVQLLEREGDLSTRSLQRMAEALDGTFTITILDGNGTLYFVKGNNPLTIFLLPELGCYIYASTSEILYEAMNGLGLSGSAKMPVTIEQGDILRIDAKGQRVLHRFDDTKLYDYTGYLSYWPTCGTVRLTAGDRAYLDELKAVASAYGYSPESIDRLARHGFLPEEIEEFIYEGACAI